MKISMDVLKMNLSDYVIGEHILSDGMSLSGCLLYELKERSFYTDCVYICRDPNLIIPHDIPAGCALLILGKLSPAQEKELAHANYMQLLGISIFALINMLHGIFRKYARLDDKMNELVQTCAPLQEIIDLGTELVQMPLCLLDLNYRVLALSQAFENSADTQWQTMKQGSAFPDYSHIEKCNITLNDLAKMADKRLEMWNESSRAYIYVQIICCGGRPIAGLGMHKIYDCKNKFDPATIRLCNYVANKLSERLMLGNDVAESRKDFRDAFLINLLDGTSIKNENMQQAIQKLGLHLMKSFCLCRIIPKTKQIRTERFFDYMEAMEQLLPNTRCAIYDSDIIMLRVSGQEFQAAADLPQAFLDYLKQQDLLCFVGLPLSSLSEMQGAYKMMDHMMQRVLPQETEAYIYYAADFLQEYAISVVAADKDISKLIHPAVLQLIKHDKENNTNYCGVLGSYFQNGESLKATADALYMHRNSLAFQLKRIEELTNVDIKNVNTKKQLIFALDCYEFSKKGLHGLTQGEHSAQRI